MSCPEPLERIFRQVEEESERRAEEEQKRAEELDKLAGEATIKKAKTRRRGSISISRLGHFNVEDGPTSATSFDGPLTPKGFSSIASNSPFYQSQMANASTSSVASGASAFSNDNAHTEDLSQVIQVQQIPPKTSSISRMIPRRLSRARSSSVIPNSDAGVPIGIDVSVQETTVHSSAASILLEEDESGSQAPSRRASVSATHSLRGQQSRATFSGTPSNGWVAKFKQKFRRKTDSSTSPPPTS